VLFSLNRTVINARVFVGITIGIGLPGLLSAQRE